MKQVAEAEETASCDKWPSKKSIDLGDKSLQSLSSWRKSPNMKNSMVSASIIGDFVFLKSNPKKSYSLFYPTN
jgi:hypothetical protein